MFLLFPMNDENDRRSSSRYNIDDVLKKKEKKEKSSWDKLPEHRRRLLKLNGRGKGKSAYYTKQLSQRTLSTAASGDSTVDNNHVGSFHRNDLAFSMACENADIDGKLSKHIKFVPNSKNPTKTKLKERLKNAARVVKKLKKPKKMKIDAAADLLSGGELIVNFSIRSSGNPHASRGYKEVANEDFYFCTDSLRNHQQLSPISDPIMTSPTNSRISEITMQS